MKDGKTKRVAGRGRRADEGVGGKGSRSGGWICARALGVVGEGNARKVSENDRPGGRE